MLKYLLTKINRKAIGFMVMVLQLNCSLLLAQSENLIQGKVLSKDDGQGLPGVNVILKGSTIGTTTDGDGKFSLSVPGKDAVLIFSFIGYKTQEVTVGAQTTFDVQLEA